MIVVPKNALTPPILVSTEMGHSSDSAVLELHPSSGMADGPFHVTVLSLPPGCQVKLTSSLVSERGGEFRCECVYVADRYGAVDTRVQSSVGGTFEGIQSTGLLDHLVAVEPGHRLLKRDVTTPWCVAVQSYVPRLQTQTANMHPVCNHTYPGA